MAEVVDSKVVAELRDQFGKGAARRIRAVGKVPATLYGHGGAEPQHLTLPAHQLSLLLRKANALLELDIAGKNQLALVKNVQKNPVRQILEHIDLIIVVKGEKVQVEVPIHLEGDPFGSAIAELDVQTINVEAEATNIPERIVVSVEDLEAGTHVTAGDITLPAGVSLLSDPELLIVGIVQPAAASPADEGAAPAAEEAAEAAE